MKRIGRVFAILAAILLIAASAMADDNISISVTADKKSVQIGEEFAVTFSISVGDPERFSLLSPPSFDDFTLINDSKKTATRLLSGAVYTTFAYKYSIKANKVGTLTIGRAVFVYSGITYKTAPVEVEALPPSKDTVKASVSSAPAPPPIAKEEPKGTTPPKIERKLEPPKKVENMPKKEAVIPKKDEAPPKKEDSLPKKVEPQPKNEEPSPKIEKDADIFVKASVNKPAPYVGEEVIYTFKFYHKLDYIGAPAFTPPQFTGFFVEELPQSRSLEKVKELDGAEFVAEEVNYAVFPLVAGEIAIPYAMLEYKDGNGAVIPLKSNSVELNVKTLPQYDQNADKKYSGGIGKFKIKLKLGATDGVQGDPIAVAVSISGSGNISGVGEPSFLNMTDFDYTLIDAKKNIAKSIDGISGDVIFTYSATPKNSGKIAFDGVELVFFDSAKGKYARVATKKETLNISPKKIEKKEAETLKASSVPPPIPADETEKKITVLYAFYKSKLFSYLMGGLLFAGLLTLSLSYKKSYELKNKKSLKKKRATKVILRGLEDARSHLHNQNIEDFYTHTHNLLTKFFLDKYDVDMATHPLDSIEDLINAPTHVKSGIKELIEKIKQLHYFRYSENKVTDEELKTCLTELKKRIKQV